MVYIPTCTDWSNSPCLVSDRLLLTRSAREEFMVFGFIRSRVSRGINGRVVVVFDVRRELESTVEELRGNVINKKSRVNMSDVENMALVLSKSRWVFENKYPEGCCLTRVSMLKSITHGVIQSVRIVNRSVT